jgi:predicted metalloprotease
MPVTHRAGGRRTVARRARWTAAIATIVLSTLAALGLLAGPAQAQETSTAPARVAQACTSLDKCYGYSELQGFYDQISLLVQDFSAATYANMPPPSYVYIPAGTRFRSACGPADGTTFAYCRPDKSVLIGQDELWHFYSDFGDAAAGFGIAHEWGHHVQNMVGVMATVSTREDRISMENQADCVGGAWIRHLSERGRLERNDLRQLDAILKAIASAEGPDRGHGTVEERVASAKVGLDSGMAGCNKFFPGAPLV